MEPAQVTRWEDSFSSWAQGPGKTEEQRCENAINAIKNAIDKSDELKHRDIDLFVQGSFRNRVNVRQDSDVDVGIICHDTFFFELPEGYTREQFGITIPADYKYSVFKNELQQALISHFGSSSVHRGNKAFDIKENSYRVEADVAPFFDYRYYRVDASYVGGVRLLPDNGGEVINWPEHHYQNGVSKNTTTCRRFKRLVRILKHLAVHMSEQGNHIAENTPGFLIECLVYNVPDSKFGHGSYAADVRAVVAFLFNETLDADKCRAWTEISELKYLFHSEQKWDVRAAHAFADAAWDFLGLE